MQRILILLFIALFIGGLGDAAVAAGKGGGNGFGGGRAAGQAGSYDLGQGNGLGLDNFGQANLGAAFRTGYIGRAVGGAGTGDGYAHDSEYHEHERILDSLAKRFDIGAKSR